MKKASPTFGQVLKERRLALHQNGAEAAEACGTTQQTISRWEIGRNVPTTVEQQLRVAEYLEIDVEDLAQLIAETVRRNIIGDIRRHLG